MVYIDKDYIAYASLYIKRIPGKGKYEVKIDNIRRKEYCDEPLSDRDKEDINRIVGGIKYIQEKAKYIKDCGGDVTSYSLTGKFV